MTCVKSFLGEFSSGVSVCRNKGTESDLVAPFCPGPPRPGGTGSPSSSSGCAAGLAGAHPGLQDRILLNYK